MKVPHLVQYQGSKRNLASSILKYFPQKFNRLIEPFAGSAAISIACATYGYTDKFLINDSNKPLSKLLELIVESPLYVADSYTNLWNEQENNSLEHYYKVRDEFNNTSNPILFLYLLARCVKGAVRYNNEGLFNQSPDKRRKGTHPEKMRKSIYDISSLLKGKSCFMSKDYKDILSVAKPGDLIYMDPPYQGVCGDRDSRYFAGIDHNEFINELANLNIKGIDYIVSYDGKCGGRVYGESLPKFLELKHLHLDAGRSTQATLLGKDDITFESLYISKTISSKININIEDQYIQIAL